MKTSKTGQYKTLHQQWTDQLTKDNYEEWAVKIERELTSKGYFGHADGTRVAPIDGGASATDRLVHYNLYNEFDTSKSETGMYIFNACTDIVRHKYLHNIPVSEPARMWTTLQQAFHGSDEVSRTNLLTKFLQMTQGFPSGFCSLVQRSCGTCR